MKVDITELYCQGIKVKVGQIYQLSKITENIGTIPKRSFTKWSGHEKYKVEFETVIYSRKNKRDNDVLIKRITIIEGGEGLCMKR